MRKKALVINPGSLFPTRAMNQVRTINMVKSLLREFHVDVLTPVKNGSEKFESGKNLGELGAGFHLLKSYKPDNNILKKRFSQVKERLSFYVFANDLGYSASRRYEKQILRFLQQNHYDFVISNYWEISGFFTKLKGRTVKLLDTHYAVSENIDLHKQKKYKVSSAFFKSRELRKSARLEKKFMEASDIVISLSGSNYDIFRSIAPHKDHIMIPDGNDIEYFHSKKREPVPNTIIFYGSMSSHQNVGAFFRFYNRILPLIREEVDNVKILVIGANPVQEIKDLHDGDQFTVTGYVKDVRDYISKGVLMILPLEIGSGFRGRVVEVMAMGVPVVGTHNALKSIEMEDGKHGFVTDSDREMADWSIRLLKEPGFRDKISRQSIEFAFRNYSIEATFDRLTDYLKEYEKNE